MIAHDDQAIGTKQWSLELLFPGDSTSGRDARQLMDQRHDRM
jgi:hypothetical protein